VEVVAVAVIIALQVVQEIPHHLLHHKVIVEEMVMERVVPATLLQVVGVVLLLREQTEYIAPLEVLVVLEHHHLSQE
jgi:hypothetical protein